MKTRHQAVLVDLADYKNGEGHKSFLLDETRYTNLIRKGTALPDLLNLGWQVIKDTSVRLEHGRAIVFVERLVPDDE